MELKLLFEVLNYSLSMPLIEPYGIEIMKDLLNGYVQHPPLIEPYGIEILIKPHHVHRL